MEDEPTTQIEFYVEPDGTVHIHRHAVSEDDVAEVLDNKPETRKEADGSQIALGMTLDGRFLRVVYLPNQESGTIFVITAFEPGRTTKRGWRRRQRRKKS